MIDVHCHLNFHSFQDDWEEVAKRAFAAGVTHIINVGTKLDSSRQAVAFAEKYETIYAIVGVHPHHADKLESGWIEELEKLARHPKVVGIGECGLDYFSYQSNGIVDPKIQKQVFIDQIHLAHRVKKPLQIHNRHAGEDVIAILKEQQKLLYKPIPGMFHCFAGSRAVHKAAIDLGFFIGFDGNITYKGLAPGETVSLSELATETPLDRILVETDSPFLTPIPHRGRRNEPSYGIITARYIADLRSIPYTDFIKQLRRNAKQVFKIIIH